MDHRRYSETIRLTGIITKPAIQGAMRSLEAIEGSYGLDACCGIGEKTLWLAEQLGPSASIIGLDASVEHLEIARARARVADRSDRIRFLRGDLRRLPFANAAFDWAVCIDSIWPVAGIDPFAVVAELRRVVRPGGPVGVLFWTGQSLLPGYPLLEAELDLAHARTNPYLGDIQPHLHFLRALGWLRACGFEDLGATAYTAQHQAPLSPETRDAVAECLCMLFGNLEAHVPDASWKLYSRLSDPSSPECIIDIPDYVCSVTYTLFRGRVPFKEVRNDGS